MLKSYHAGRSSQGKFRAKRFPDLMVVGVMWKKRMNFLDRGSVLTIVGVQGFNLTSGRTVL